MKSLDLLIISIFASCICLVQPVMGQAVSLSATVKDTAFVFSGYTAPNSFISIIENSAITGTTSSAADGSFSKYISDTPGSHTIDLESTDTAGLTVSVEFNFQLLAHQEMDLSDINMPASISTNMGHYTSEDTILISGYAKPDSQIRITLSGPQTVINTVNTDSNGKFLWTFPEKGLLTGNYSLSTELLVNGNSNNSTIGQSISFSIDNDMGITPSPVPTNSCPYAYANLCYFDKQDSGYISSKEEFTSYLNGYIQYFDQNISNTYDINKDGRVTAVDLSIILYYWRGDTTQISGYYNNMTVASVQGVSTSRVPTTSGMNPQPPINQGPPPPGSLFLGLAIPPDLLGTAITDEVLAVITAAGVFGILFFIKRQIKRNQ